jgi:hypothetical protein
MDGQTVSVPLQGRLKRENILKLSPSGDLLEHIKQLRDDAVAREPDMVPLKDADLHFTLVKDNVCQVPRHLDPAIPVPPTPLTFDAPQLASETKPDGSVKRSVFVRVHQQESLNELVINIIGEASPDTKRFYHVTLATLTGSPRGAVSYPDPGSPTLNDHEP